MNAGSDRARLERHRDRARREADVYVGGRLGTYRYLDMHMAIASALTLCDTTILTRLRSRS